MTGITPIGIDLGTTRCAIAAVSPMGETVMLTDQLGSVLTPSVVHFSDEATTVGWQALRMARFETQGIADNVKLDMGRPLYRRSILGKAMPPEVVAAMVLMHLKEIVVSQVGDRFQAVITVPAFFDERRRKATADACQMAGLDLLDIINEPTAAAMAFGEQLGYLSNTGEVKSKERLLVYDLGGGTFDVSLVELQPDGFFTLATGGDTGLGGKNWDDRLADFVAQKFEAENGLDPRNDELAMSRIRQDSEQLKQALTARHHATVIAEFGGRSSKIDVTREQFESLTDDLLERTAHTTDLVRRDANVQWNDVGRILLVGGSTRMPMVARRLYELTGMSVDQSVNPDEAVARGAAVYAANRLAEKGQSHIPFHFRVVDVNSHSLGIQGVDVATGRKENSIIIPRNTPLPVKIMKRFVTRIDNQPSLMIRILEGETTNPDDCITIGQATLRDLPEHLPKGHPIDVTFAYQRNGRLTVQTCVPGTERQMELVLERGEMLSPEHVEKWRNVLTSGEAFRSFQEMLRTILNIRYPNNDETA